MEANYIVNSLHNEISLCVIEHRKRPGRTGLGPLERQMVDVKITAGDAELLGKYLIAAAEGAVIAVM